MGIIYATIGFEGEGCYYFIGNCCLYIDIEMNSCFGNYMHVI